MTVTAADLKAIPTLDPSRCCALHVRRSSAAGGGANHSLAEQEADGRRLAEREGLTVVRVYREREGTGASLQSGKRRPEWERALADLDNGADFRTIITAAIDRADRRGADVLGSLLTRHSVTGRRILTLTGEDTSDPNQRLAIIVRGETAREETDRLSSRVSRTKRHRREGDGREGSWLGGRPPYGLTVARVPHPTRTGETVSTGRLIHHPEHYATARRIADALLGGATLWDVCKALNAEGVPGPNAALYRSQAAREKNPDKAAALLARADGPGWGVPSVAAMVKAPAWAGLQSIRHRERRPDGTWSPWPYRADVYLSPETGEPVRVGEGVITPEERAVILDRLASRARSVVVGTDDDGEDVARRRGDRVGTHLLVDVLRCPSCGGRTSLYGARSRRYVRCSQTAQAAHRCEGFSAPVDDLEDYVTRRMRTRLAALDPTDPEDFAALLAAASAWEGERSPATRARRVALEARRVALAEEDARAVRLAVSGVLSEDEARDARRDAADRLAVVEADLRALREETVDPAGLLDAAMTAEAWERLDVADRRRVVAAMVERVEVSRAGRRGVRFDPLARVQIDWRRP